MAAKSTTTIRQILSYQPHQAAWFVATQALFNQVVAFYFEVIQAHEKLLDLHNKDALTTLEMLTHTTQKNPSPVMPLEEIGEDLPALFRRAAINAALGSARSFCSHLQKWRKRKEKAVAKGKTFTERPPVPPRTWNKSVPFYGGQWKERTPSRNTSLALPPSSGRSQPTERPPCVRSISISTTTSRSAPSKLLKVRSWPPHSSGVAKR
jgi:putative transposase